MTKNRWMIFVFVFYVAMAFGFGGCYYGMYKKDRSSFAFNGDIQKAQARAVEPVTRKQLKDLDGNAALLFRLQKGLGDRGAEPAVATKLFGMLQSSVVSVGDETFTITCLKPPPDIGHREQPRTSLTVKLADGTEASIEGRPYYQVPETRKAFLELANRWIEDLNAERTAAHLVLESLKGDTPDVWSYADFLYFSAITQFTVGYGDILPNSTGVRLVVVLQTMLAAMLIVVVINLAVGGKHGD